MSAAATARRALATLAIVALLAGASWSSVLALLQQQADLQLDAWQRGETPWRWDFAQADAVVWPGSTGFTLEHDGEPLAGRIDDGDADLSLALAGRAIDLSLVAHAELVAAGDAPLSVRLIGERDGVPLDVTAAARVQPAQATTRLPLVSTARHAALRLHLHGAPGTRVRVQSLRLLPRPGLRPEPCAAFPCAQSVAVLDAPRRATPERLLAWRDAVAAAQPATIVTTGATALVLRSVDALQRAGSSQVAILLSLLPLGALLASWLRPSPLRARRAGAELAALFVPWLALQWAGVDGEPGHHWGFVAYVAALASALAIRTPGPLPRWRGDAKAWRALRGFVLGALLLLAACAAWNLAYAASPRLLSADMLWRYPLWTLLQQWVLMHAIAPRMRALFGTEAAAALAVGALFGLLHVPNFALMLLTFGAGSAWAWLGYRQRAILPLAATHAVFGLAIFALAPATMLRSADTGSAYLQLQAVVDP